MLIVVGRWMLKSVFMRIQKVLSFELRTNWRRFEEAQGAAHSIVSIYTWSCQAWFSLTLRSSRSLRCEMRPAMLTIMKIALSGDRSNTVRDLGFRPGLSDISLYCGCIFHRYMRGNRSLADNLEKPFTQNDVRLFRWVYSVAAFSSFLALLFHY